MRAFILRRLGLAALSVLLVTFVIFFMTHILPGNAAERILGNLAERELVDTLTLQLGLDKPIIVQYWNWLTETLSGNLGNSIQYSSIDQSQEYSTKVTEILVPAIGYSARLAIFAFLLVVPLSIIGGVTAALNRGKIIDRVITVGGLSAAVVPEFVWAVLLVLVVGVKLEWLPVTAFPDEGSNFLTQMYYLILPAISLVLVLFGYIARIARAGVIEAMDADYTRTAILKGFTRRRAVTKHVLRNALLPTIAVIASQVPYLVGGLVAVEIVFNYPGFGNLLLTSVLYRDYPVLQGAVLIIGTVIVVVQLVADIIFALLNPRIRQKLTQ